MMALSGWQADRYSRVLHEKSPMKDQPPEQCVTDPDGEKPIYNLLFLLHVFPWENGYKMVMGNINKKINMEQGRGA